MMCICIYYLMLLICVFVIKIYVIYFDLIIEILLLIFDVIYELNVLLNIRYRNGLFFWYVLYNNCYIEIECILVYMVIR